MRAIKVVCHLGSRYKPREPTEASGALTAICNSGSKFCYPVDGHSCVKASTSVAEETADIFPKMAKMPACKFGKGASAETKGTGLYPSP